MKKLALALGVTVAALGGAAVMDTPVEAASPTVEVAASPTVEVAAATTADADVSIEVVVWVEGNLTCYSSRTTLGYAGVCYGGRYYMSITCKAWNGSISHKSSSSKPSGLGVQLNCNPGSYPIRVYLGPA